MSGRDLALVGGNIYVSPAEEPICDGVVLTRGGKIAAVGRRTSVQKVLGAMKEAGVALIPTLKLWRHELRRDRRSDLEAFAGRGVEQLRAWVTSGGEVLFGTDVGYMDDYDPSDEYALMAEAGMSASEILAALTTAPAELWRREPARTHRHRFRRRSRRPRRRSGQGRPGLRCRAIHHA